MEAADLGHRRQLLPPVQNGPHLAGGDGGGGGGVLGRLGGGVVKHPVVPLHLHHKAVAPRAADDPQRVGVGVTEGGGRHYGGLKGLRRLRLRELRLQNHHRRQHIPAIPRSRAIAPRIPGGQVFVPRRSLGVGTKHRQLQPDTAIGLIDNVVLKEEEGPRRRQHQHQQHHQQNLPQAPAPMITIVPSGRHSLPPLDS